MDLNHIYDILENHTETLARIDENQRIMNERLFGANGVPGAIPYLAEQTKKQGKQIEFWRGALAVLTFLWTGAIAIAAAMIKRH